jgi:tRNA threonylcarbamoyladenosine biosynthesis protein TsaB
MRVLAFDTCFAAIGIAVLDGSTIAAHWSEDVSGGHGEKLLPLIEETLARAGLAFADLDRIAVTLGPGGFTGVRVGVAVARALALSTGKPLVGMSSLELLARTAVDGGLVHADQPATVLATADGRQGLLYAQPLAVPAWQALAPPSLVAAADLAAKWTETGIVAVGAGAGAVKAASGGRIHAAGEALLPDARVLAVAAPHLTPLAEPRPLYVRAADAKPQTGKSLPRA